MISRILIMTLLFGFSGCSSAQKFPPYEYGSAEREKLPKMTLLNHSKIMKNILGEPKLRIETIGILVYDGVNTMEAIAPMAVFSELMSVKIDFISVKKGVVHSTLVDVEATKTLEEVKKLDLLVIPGGNKEGLISVLNNDIVLKWLTLINDKTAITASIGSGGFIAGAASLLQEKQVSLPWFKGVENAALFNASYSSKRYTNDGKLYSCAGNMTAIDMCLKLIEEIAGNNNLQGAMLDLEYDPKSPLKAGIPELTSEKVIQKVQQRAYSINNLQILDEEYICDTTSVKNIGILVYKDFFTLDAIGPLVVLSQMPNVQVKLLTKDDNKVKSGRAHFFVKDRYTDVTNIDILIIPGGATGTWALTQNTSMLDWIRRTDKQTIITGSVCTGSWVLGAAGLLKNKRASTNWYRAKQVMQHYDAIFTEQRYTIDGKYWTSAGVSAGIDMSFAIINHLLGKEATETAMLNLAYHPEPPYPGGSPQKTNDLVLDMMHQMYDYMMIPLLKKDEIIKKSW